MNVLSQGRALVERKYSRIRRLPVRGKRAGEVGQFFKVCDTPHCKVSGTVEFRGEVAQLHRHAQFIFRGFQTMLTQSILEVQGPRAGSYPPRKRSPKRS